MLVRDGFFSKEYKLKQNLKTRNFLSLEKSFLKIKNAFNNSYNSDFDESFQKLAKRGYFNRYDLAICCEFYQRDKNNCNFDFVKILGW